MSVQSSPRHLRGVFGAMTLAIVAIAANVLAAALSPTVSADEQEVVLAAVVPPSTSRFSLVGDNGQDVTEKDFRDRFLLIYFGYTYCPDVCPAGLQTMSEAIDLMGPAGDRVQPLFITVDPERDTADLLADYVEAFHPRLIGLTGTPTQIKAAATAHGARYFKLFYPWSGDDEAEDGEPVDEYAMSHTSYTYLMGPDGDGLMVFPHGTRPDRMAQELRRFVADD